MLAPAVQLLRRADFAPEVDVRVDEETATRPEPPCRVVLHNDDRTPMELVVQILVTAFALTWGRASWLMLRAHVTGIAIVGVMPRAEAERRVAHAGRLAGDWPLRFTIDEA